MIQERTPPAGEPPGRDDRPKKNGSHDPKPQRAAPARPSGPDLEEMVGLLWRKKWLLAAISVPIAVAIGILSWMFLPKSYTASSSVLPPLESREGLGSSLLSALPAAALPLAGSLGGMGSTTTDNCIAFLKSRVMTDAVIEKFQLKSRYKLKTMYATRLRLEQSTKIATSKEKVISITVDASSPELAADMANFYVANLDQLYRSVTVTKAGQTSAFLEKRLVQAKEKLTEAEDALRDFQQKNKAVSVDAQSKMMIEAGASLQSQITAQEVQLQVMSGYLSPDNPELTRTRAVIDGLRRQLHSLAAGTDKPSSRSERDRLHPAISAMPNLQLAFARLLREVKTQEQVYLFLVTQYEQAKLAAARDTPQIQLLDPAVPPERFSSPRPVFNAGVVGLLTGIIASLLLLRRARRDSTGVSQA